jgi:ABC-type branched-subunit amino acid transport system substrate-binding protein
MKNYNRIILGVVIIALFTIIVVMTNQKNNNDSIKIGLISSLTGLVFGGDNLGQGFANGFILAHEEYSKANPDKKIEIFIEDDGYDPKKGVSAYKKLISINGINALVNLSSATIDPIKDSVITDDIPVIQVFAESDVAVDNIYQIYPDQTSVGILGDLANKQNNKKVLILHPQIKAYSKFISDFDLKYNGELVIEAFGPDEKDFSTIALKAKEINADGVVVFMGAVQGGQLLKQFRNINYKPKNLYFDIGLQFGVEDYKNALGSLEFMNGSQGLYLSVDSNEDFKQKYIARFGAPVPTLAGLGYDAFYTMIENYNSDTNKWRSNMNSYTINGTTGNISFSPEGLRPAQWKISKIENGELIIN